MTRRSAILSGIGTCSRGGEGCRSSRRAWSVRPRDGSVVRRQFRRGVRASHSGDTFRRMVCRVGPESSGQDVSRPRTEDRRPRSRTVRRRRKDAREAGTAIRVSGGARASAVVCEGFRHGSSHCGRASPTPSNWWANASTATQESSVTRGQDWGRETPRVKSRLLYAADTGGGLTRNYVWNWWS